MTSIQVRGCFYRERISKGLLQSLPFLESSHNEALVGPLIIGTSKSLVAKYIKKDLQKILRTILKARVPPSDKPHEKLLNAKSHDVDRSKSYIECYNFC